MPNSITRNIRLCLSRLMSCSSSPVTTTSNNLPNSEDSDVHSSSSPPRTPSPVLFNSNYNSLYDPTAASSSSYSDDTLAATFTTATATAADDSTTSDTESDPDLSSALASRRLLPPSSPGRSNAIADPSTIAVGIGVAVPTYSPDPYGDFRRSMQEMAAAMGLLGPRVGEDTRRRRRERLYELLLCYLTLNRKHAHKYIVGAFADLLVRTEDEDGDDDDDDEGERSGR